GEDVEGEDVGGPLCGGRGEHADGALDGVGGQRLPVAGDLGEFVDEALGERDVTGGAGEGHDVAAHVDVDGGEARLDRPEHLVTLAEEEDHGHVVGDRDLVLEHRVRPGRVVAV